MYKNKPTLRMKIYVVIPVFHFHSLSILKKKINDKSDLASETLL